MAVFHYKAIAADGKLLDGEMEAADAPSVISQLQAAGHMPIKAEPKSEKLAANYLARRLSLWRKRVRPRDLTFLLRELATLIGAGIPLDSSLRILERHAEGALREALKGVHADVQSGKPLSNALAAQGGMIDSLSINLIRAGETSGALDVVMQRLAVYREQADAARAQLLSALTYPLILIGVALVSLFVLMTFVVPRFVPLFTDAGSTLPVLTQIVFFVAGALQRFWWLVPLIMAGGLFLAERWLAVPGNRLRFDFWTLRTPLVGQVVLFAETARFARTLATLLRNGLPLLTALKLSRDVLRNRVLAAAVEQCAASVRSGGRLAETLRREEVFPVLAVDLIAVGEESGQLEDMLDKGAESFESKVQQQLKRLLTLLEPMLILGLGALIAVVIVAILQAMLGLNDLVV